MRTITAAEIKDSWGTNIHVAYEGLARSRRRRTTVKHVALATMALASAYGGFQWPEKSAEVVTYHAEIEKLDELKEKRKVLEDGGVTTYDTLGKTTERFTPVDTVNIVVKGKNIAYTDPQAMDPAIQEQEGEVTSMARLPSVRDYNARKVARLGFGFGGLALLLGGMAVVGIRDKREKKHKEPG